MPSFENYKRPVKTKPFLEYFCSEPNNNVIVK